MKRMKVTGKELALLCGVAALGSWPSRWEPQQEQ